MKKYYRSLFVPVLLFIMSMTVSNILYAVNKNNDTKNAEILTTVSVIDKNEINAAQVIMNSKEINNEVLDYAKLLNTAHKDNLDEAKKLAKSLNLKESKDSTSKDLEAQGKKLKKTLSMQKGTELQKLYIDQMIKGHEDALNLIKNTLMNETKNQEIIDFLTNTATHVQSHLDKAKEIKNNLG